MNGQHYKKINFVWMTLVALMLALPTGGWAATAGSVDIRVSDVVDDAAESTGIVTTAIDDLALGQGDAVGIRFQGLTIPQGSAITRAYIQFTADVVNSDSTDLVVHTEKHDDAPAFATMPNNIMARTRSTASVPWASIPVWGSASETGVIHQSADLSEIVEEVVTRAGWVTGNAIVFIIEGSGNRIARAYQGDPAKAPLLHVEYAAGAIDVPISDPDDDAQEDGVGAMQTGTLHLDLDDEHLVGLRFRDVNVPPGAEIIKAYISLAATVPQADDTSISIYVQNHDDAPAFTSSDHNISARDLSEEYTR